MHNLACKERVRPCLHVRIVRSHVCAHGVDACAQLRGCEVIKPTVSSLGNTSYSNKVSARARETAGNCACARRSLACVRACQLGHRQVSPSMWLWAQQSWRCESLHRPVTTQAAFDVAFAPRLRRRPAAPPSEPTLPIDFKPRGRSRSGRAGSRRRLAQTGSRAGSLCSRCCSTDCSCMKGGRATYGQGGRMIWDRRRTGAGECSPYPSWKAGCSLYPGIGEKRSCEAAMWRHRRASTCVRVCTRARTRACIEFALVLQSKAALQIVSAVQEITAKPSAGGGAAWVQVQLEK
eukprot:5883922-Pleurochrysis_carterae.AAC.3